MHRPRLAILRQATKEIHAELEGIVDRLGFFDSPRRYGDYLRRLHSFYRQLEASISGDARRSLAAWSLTDRIGWLTRDLEALALEPLPFDSSRDQRKPFHDRARALGALYVLLGASLGARVLIEKAERLLPEGGEGRTYLSGVGAQSNWNRFLDHLELERAISTDEMCRGAVETFVSIREHLLRTEAA